MKHVFNEIDAAAVRVTSFVQLLVGAAVLLMVVATTGARCRNHHRELLLVLFLLGHFALGLWVGKLFTRKEKKLHSFTHCRTLFMVRNHNWRAAPHGHNRIFSVFLEE